MKALARIFEIDRERDRKECVSLDQKTKGSDRELAQWLLDHPKYKGVEVARWLGCGALRIQRLRAWAQEGFNGSPYDKSNATKTSSTTRPRLKTKQKKVVRPSDPTQEHCADCGTAEEHWHRSLGNLAGDAISMREFWTREFGDWREFEVSSSLVTLAKQAARVWTELAAELTKRGG